MLKRISALIIASAALVGALEDPAHSSPIEEAALMAIAAGVCGISVPDAQFMRRVQAVAIQTGFTVDMAITLVSSQAEIYAARLVDAGKMGEFCTRAQLIKFD